MKREAFRHPKTLDLAARLGLPSHAYALAHVSYLFNAAADIAPQGNIGKWPNGVIARSAEWTSDPDSFVDSLVLSGWLDVNSHQSVRLLIHDWPEHAERFVKAKLARDGIWFHWAYYLNGREWNAPDGLQLVIPDDYCTPVNTTVATTVPTIDASPPYDPTQPIQTNPKPNPTKRVRKVKAYAYGFDDWYAAYPKHVAKDHAAAAYGRAITRICEARDCLPDDAHAWLLAVTQRFAGSPAGKASDQPGDMQYVPHPATWLNAGRFNDDESEWQRIRVNGKPSVADEWEENHRKSEEDRKIPIKKWIGTPKW